MSESDRLQSPARHSNLWDSWIKAHPCPEVDIDPDSYFWVGYNRVQAEQIADFFEETEDVECCVIHNKVGKRYYIIRADSLPSLKRKNRNGKSKD